MYKIKVKFNGKKKEHNQDSLGMKEWDIIKIMLKN